MLSRGQKYPKDFVKTVILLYLRDTEKPASDIRDFLKNQFELSERRNIQKHLNYLFDHHVIDKKVRAGIESRYKWSKNIQAVRTIVNLISETESVEQISNKLFRQIKKQQTKWHKNYGTSQSDAKYDPIKLWYRTNYILLFFNKKTISNSLKLAYNKYRKKNNKKHIKFKRFRIIVLERLTDDELITMMYYSPTLVKYILNLDIHYEHKLANLNRIENKINNMVLVDWLQNKPHFGVKESFNDGIYIKKDVNSNSLDINFHSKLLRPKPQLIDHSIEIKYEPFLLEKYKKHILFVNNKKISKER